MYCACHTAASRGPSGDHARRSSSRRLCVLPLPHESQPQPKRRPRAQQLLQKALCAAPSRSPSGDHARSSSARRLCVLRLPHGSQPRAKRRPRAPQLLQEALCTAPATRKPAAAQAATTRTAAPLEGSVYCPCQTAASRGPSSDDARRSSSRRLCVLRLPHESQPRPKRRPRARQLLQKALCAAPLTREAAAAQAATMCAAAPPKGSVCCACHTAASRGPSGDHARRSSSRRLCVLRLPHESQPRPKRRPRAPQLVQKALCTAPATRQPAAGKLCCDKWCDELC